MWQTIIIALIALTFKAAAAYSAKKKREEEVAQRERLRMERSPQGAPMRTAIPIAPVARTMASPPVVARTMVAPAPFVSAIPGARRAPAVRPQDPESRHNAFFDAVVETLRSHTPAKTSELRTSEGEATSAQLKKTVAMIHEGVLHRRHAPGTPHAGPVLPAKTPSGPHAPVSKRSIRLNRRESRRAIVLTEIFGRPRSVEPY